MSGCARWPLGWPLSSGRTHRRSSVRARRQPRSSTCILRRRAAWGPQAEIDGARPGNTTDDAQRSRELVREVREMR